MIPKKHFPDGLIDMLQRYDMSWADWEAAILVAHLRKYGGVRARTARKLKIEKRTFARRLLRVESLGYHVPPSRTRDPTLYKTRYKDKIDPPIDSRAGGGGGAGGKCLKLYFKKIDRDVKSLWYPKSYILNEHDFCDDDRKDEK